MITAFANEIATLNAQVATAQQVHALSASDALCRIIDTLGLEAIEERGSSATYQLETGRLVNADFATGEFNAQTAPTRRFAVWGCGAWPERSQVTTDDAADLITEDMPEFDLLPSEFVTEWGFALGSEHWAEIITADEADLDAATRFSANVSGYAEIK